MINVSNEFKELMNQRTDFKENADITFSDGSKLYLTEKDFTISNNSVIDGSGINSIPLGVAIERYIQIEIDNHDDRFTDYDFAGAIINLKLKFQLSTTVETINFGKFTVVNPATYGQTIIITAVDDMYKADIAYGTTLTFPATAQVVLRDSCNTCDISLLTGQFSHNDFIINEMPSSEYTHRQVIGFIAMLACGNARINTNGYLEILEYDFYNSLYRLDKWKTGLKIETSDVVITGIKIAYENSEGEKKHVFFGNEGYVLQLENPLASGREDALASNIADVLLNQAFRPFSGDYTGFPIAEFMDQVLIIDRKGNEYNTFLTDVNYTFFGFTSLKNSAEPGIRQRSKYSNPETEIIKKAQQLITAEKNLREQAIKKLNESLANASGMFSTEEEQEDGSTIYYLHDKATIAESENVIKFTAEAIGFSLDGGKTYPYGFTLNGEMVMNIIRTEGLSADYIHTGYLSADRIKGGINLMTGGYDTFEQISRNSLYLNGELVIPGLIDVAENQSFYGKKSLKIAVSSAPEEKGLFGIDGNGFVKGIPGKLYKASCYVKALGNSNINLSVYKCDQADSNASFEFVNTVNQNIGTLWTRLETQAFSVDENCPYIALSLGINTPLLTHYFDAFQIEEVKNAESYASEFMPAGTTVINGGNIAAKSITSDKITVDELSAIAAKIAGFILKDSKFYTEGKDSLESINNGVYVGSDGISIGKGFKATADGKTASGEFYSVGEGVSPDSPAYKMAALSSGFLKFLWGINPEDTEPYLLGGINPHTTATSSAANTPATSGVIMYVDDSANARFHYVGIGTKPNVLTSLFMAMFTGIANPSNSEVATFGFNGETHIISTANMVNNPFQMFANALFRKNIRCTGTIYDSSGTAVTSDINKKNSMEKLDENLIISFLNALNPVSFKYNDGTSDRKHWGLIAQHVKEALDKLGIDTKDFAGYIEENSEGETTCYIRPTEFIAPLIKGYQALYKENENLKKRISAIETALGI